MTSLRYFHPAASASSSESQPAATVITPSGDRIEDACRQPLPCRSTENGRMDLRCFAVHGVALSQGWLRWSWPTAGPTGVPPAPAWDLLVVRGAPHRARARHRPADAVAWLARCRAGPPQRSRRPRLIRAGTVSGPGEVVHDRRDLRRREPVLSAPPAVRVPSSFDHPAQCARRLAWEIPMARLWQGEQRLRVRPHFLPLAMSGGLVAPASAGHITALAFRRARRTASGDGPGGRSTLEWPHLLLSSGPTGTGPVRSHMTWRNLS